MKYVYQLNGNEFDIFISDNASDSEVTLRVGKKTHDSIIQKDESGKFFIYKKTKIYLADLKPVLLQEIKSKINFGHTISPIEIIQAITELPIYYTDGSTFDDFYLKKCEDGKWKGDYEVTCHKKDSTIPDVKRELSAYNLAFLINHGMVTL